MDADFELLERWRAGDKGAGNQLFQRYFDSLYRFFENKLESGADELVQATLLSCVRSRDSFRKQSSFRTYLFTIARNELYAHLRSMRRHRADLDFDEVSVADLQTTPSRRIAREEERQALLLALRSLPVEQQLMLELYYWEEVSSAELAEILGIQEPALRARLSRARKALGERLQAMAGSPLPEHATMDDLDAWARRMREQGAERRE